MTLASLMNMLIVDMIAQTTAKVNCMSFLSDLKITDMCFTLIPLLGGDTFRKKKKVYQKKSGSILAILTFKNLKVENAYRVSPVSPYKNKFG